MPFKVASHRAPPFQTEFAFAHPDRDVADVRAMTRSERKHQTLSLPFPHAVWR